METKRELDQYFMTMIQENKEEHKEIKDILKSIQKKLSDLCVSSGETSVKIKNIEKEVFGNGKKGISKKVEENTYFIKEYKQDIESISELKSTILKWTGGIVVIVSIISLIINYIMRTV